MRLPASRAFLSTAFLRYIAVALLLILIAGWIKFTPQLSLPRSFGSAVRPSPPTPPLVHKPLPQDVLNGTHPIDKLVASAEQDFHALLAKESKTLEVAAAAYRKRRGRHPPPGFKAWFEFAQKNDVIIIEDFFDQIYHDLNPFWGLEAHKIRKEAKNSELVISVRNGKARNQSDRPWMKLWHDLIRTIQKSLPDMDIPINGMDEPRLVVPWEKIEEYMMAESRSRKLAPVQEVISDFTGEQSRSEVTVRQPTNADAGLQELDKAPPEELKIEWSHKVPYFETARKGCHPESLSRKADVQRDWSRPPQILMKYALAHSTKGYISNWTLASDFCHQPDLQGLHGTFIEPISIASSDRLLPLFGGSKLATNNEILLPPAMYWSTDERYHGGEQHGNAWEEKHNKLIWRGAATGGRNHESTWQAFQRFRFASLLNGTQVSRAESWTELAPDFTLPPGNYDLRAAREGHLGEWVSEWGDSGFMDLLCQPPEPEKKGCFYSGRYFEVQGTMPMADQYAYKYLPDIDGNSFSGRYRGFLRSNALPLKATIYREWHDSRLVPWKHFVPLDNRFLDLYGVVEYFLGYSGGGNAENRVEGRDAVARRLAEDGQAWAEKVLRTQDMQAYVFRLLLEYARISDDKRELLGFVDDLKETKKVPRA
ncbi:MAG: hypothetical protein M1825_003491 [Sarcosagium campestre]|nr:MAG: hypothetical protein M1825_003491 [Sarcosagium campestre]